MLCACFLRHSVRATCYWQDTVFGTRIHTLYNMNRPEELQHMRATVEQICTLAGMPPSWEGIHPSNYKSWHTGSTEEAKIAFNVLALDLNVEQLAA